MHQFRTILRRLRKPSVLISVFSQVLTITMLFQINHNLNIITGVMTGVCSILVLLGILSDPNTMNKGYGDDFALCTGCNKMCEHVQVNGNMICRECGCVNCIKKDK